MYPTTINASASIKVQITVSAAQARAYRTKILGASDVESATSNDAYNLLEQFRQFSCAAAGSYYIIADVRAGLANYGRESCLLGPLNEKRHRAGSGICTSHM